MTNQASNRIEKLKDKIMAAWEERALKEVKAATHQEQLALHDSLPEFLSQISDALSTTIDRTAVRMKFDRDESSRIGKKHGRERAGSLNYTMDQLIFEYHILRQVICDEMENEASLTDVEREVITCAVEQAVNDAATQFSETLADIQETFTHTLAHDLRGPIATTKLSAQIILKKAHDVDTCIKIGGRIVTMMDRLDGMIHDLLDSGRLKAGSALTINKSECDLDEILRFVVEEKNFLHDFRVKYNSPGRVMGNWDEKGIHRVFENLISNALKYSPVGSAVTVDVRQDKSNVVINFRNSGKVIPVDELAILFQQYRRARTMSEKPGWGLGLTVVKGITEAHDGKVEVRSSEEEGTNFMVTLPRGNHII